MLKTSDGFKDPVGLLPFRLRDLTSPQSGCLKLCLSHITFCLNTIAKGQKTYGNAFLSSILLETKKLLGLDFQFHSGKIVLFSSWSTGSGINHLKTVSQNTVERSVNLKAEACFLFEKCRVSRSFVNAPRHRCQSEAVTHPKWPDGGSLD